MVTAKTFMDADWGSNTDDRRSVSVVMVLIGKAPVVFKSKYQSTVAPSSAKPKRGARNTQGRLRGYETQLADMHTKGLGIKTTKFLRDACGIKSKVTKQYR
ncbi:unnamed protein product [Peronospora belbahrii]|nr:unnamed protein product [Peronospora belbahrii]